MLLKFACALKEFHNMDFYEKLLDYTSQIKHKQPTHKILKVPL